MNRILICFFLLLILQTQAFAQECKPILKNVKQVLFLGNSITYRGEYLAYLETNYRLQHPESDINWINLGLPSETGHARPGLSEGLPLPEVKRQVAILINQIQDLLVRK